jgi:WD40 repeat protein
MKCILSRFVLLTTTLLLLAGLGNAEVPGGKKVAPVVIQPEQIKINPGDPLTLIALVSQPTPIEGVQSWTLETRHHRGGFHHMALSPDGRYFATGGTDGAVRIWEVKSGKFVRALVGHHRDVSCLAWSPDGNTLASGGVNGDQTVRLWDTRSGQTLRILREHKVHVSRIAWSADGKHLAVVGDTSGLLVHYDAVTGKPLESVELGKYIYSVAWRPDGKTLACGCSDLAIQVRNLPLEKKTGRALGKDADTGLGTAFSPDGKLLAGGSGATTYIWNAETGAILHAFDGQGYAVAFSPDGTILAAAAAGGPMRLYKVDTGTLLKTLPSTTLHLAWSPDGATLISGYNTDVSVWDVETAKPLRSFAVGSWLSVHWAPGKPIVTGQGNKKLTLWSPTTAKTMHILEGHTEAVTSLAWSPSGKTLASGGADKSVRLWDATTGKETQFLEGHTAAVTSVSWAPDARTLASGGDRTARLWDPAAGKLLHTLEGHEGTVTCVAWSPDSKTVASTCGDKNLKLWKGDTGQPLRTIEVVPPIFSVAFALDGKNIVSGGDDWTRVWDVKTGKPSLARESGGSPRTITSLAWSRNGVMLAEGRANHCIQVWNTQKDAIALYTWILVPCQGVAWTPDGTRVAASTSARCAWLWNPDVNKHRAVLVADERWIGLVQANGHYASTPGVESDFVYVVQTEKGQVTLEPQAFAAKYRWKNTPASALAELNGK